MIILIFGATGSAGGGVLSACLADSGVSEIRVVVRRPVRVENPRLRQFVHADFLDFASVKAAFSDVDACFYCLGVSTTQVSGEPEYRQVTHAYALAAARMLKTSSPSARFQFISGQGAALDSRFMWARVKAETERDLIDTINANCFRPAYIDGAGSASEPGLYKVIRPILRRVLRPFPQLYVAAEEIGRAMLRATRLGLRAEIIPNARIHELAARS
jgi:uncharacterized protein YbjT (DUF2867 family)